MEKRLTIDYHEIAEELVKRFKSYKTNNHLKFDLQKISNFFKESVEKFNLYNLELYKYYINFSFYSEFQRDRK